MLQKWYSNMTGAQRIFVWIVAVVFPICSIAIFADIDSYYIIHKKGKILAGVVVGLIPLFILIYIKLGSIGEGDASKREYYPARSSLSSENIEVLKDYKKTLDEEKESTLSFPENIEDGLKNHKEPLREGEPANIWVMGISTIIILLLVGSCIININR